jgi:hypothetical protein
VGDADIRERNIKEEEKLTESAAKVDQRWVRGADANVSENARDVQEND